MKGVGITFSGETIAILTGSTEFNIDTDLVYIF